MKPQTFRVLRVLRQRPVTLADFDCQPACDGGDRITRLGARIQDLKDDGYRLRSERVGHIARYTLIAEPDFPQGRIPAEDGQVQRESTGGAAPPAASASVTERPHTATEIPGVHHAGEGRACPQLSLLDGMAA